MPSALSFVGQAVVFAVVAAFVGYFAAHPVRSYRGSHLRANSIANWFVALFHDLGYEGCSSHSCRHSFITVAARKVHRSGCSLRDVQLLARPMQSRQTDAVSGSTETLAIPVGLRGVWRSANRIPTVFAVLRPKSPASLSPQNSVSWTTRWRGPSRGFAFAKLSAEEGLQWMAVASISWVRPAAELAPAVPGRAIARTIASAGRSGA